MLGVGTGVTSISIGSVVSAHVIINLAHVLFHATSVTTNTYVQFPVINCQLVYELPFNVAEYQVVVSEKIMLTHPVYVAHVVTHENVGGILSIHVTFPVACHVFPARS